MSVGWKWRWFGWWVVAALGASVSVPAQSSSRDEELRATLPVFRDVTSGSGICFQHINGIREEKNYIPEAKGGGAGFLDFDGDGWQDLVLTQGSTVERHARGDDPPAVLYRNRGDGTFEDVTEAARFQARGWGMGVAAGDYDNDGDVDVYLTYLGPNVLLRNNGDGTFTDVTRVAGVGDARWSTSAAFGDYDGDGDLDLYVANYLAVNFEALPPKACRHRETIVLCGPMGLQGVGDSLYRNNGDGTFSEVSAATGAEDRSRYYGLGVVWSDLDGDGDLDLYVGNDATPNLLFVNQGDGSFQEAGLLSGLAVNAEGREQATMGIDAADYDNDGRIDLYLTHFADDYSTLYRNEGGLIFRDVTAQAQILRPELGLVSWGTRFIDFNHDGWKDIHHANGHVYPYLITAALDETYDQPGTVYINRGDGTFLDASGLVGEDLQVPRTGRGVAYADFDNDGDFDFLQVNLNGSPALFRTDRRDRNSWIMFQTRGSRSNRDGLGARITVVAGGLTQVQEVRRCGSIYSSHDPRAHFGLGVALRVDRVTVRWPSGLVQEFRDVQVNRHYLLDEDAGLKPIGPG
ncbi:MAG: CRTAC1 family protein [Acidobacteriota bacterium]